ncbi:MAG: cysteine desulfurase family protein [Hyphomicrobiaceae bacterium]
MKAVRTYLDWNASAPLRREARAAMVAALDLTGNPSSVHAEGRRVRALVEEARERVAALVGARPAEVIFTSGATEANNWALAAGWDIIFVSDIEHDSVLAPARASGARIVRIPVSHQGITQTEVVASGMPGHSGASGRTLVSLQMANNETGIIQPVATAALAREHGVSVHTDAAQAAGRVPVDFAALDVDLLSLSSHKLGGPKGVGALVVREGTEIPAFVTGGGQERRRRAGTENVAAIAGFGAAASAALSDVKEAQRVAAQRDHLERSLRRLTPEAVIIGQSVERLPNTTCVAWPGKAAETLVIKLDLAGIAVSAGSACSSGKVGPSHVLAAMNLPADIARSAVRISIGPTTNVRDIRRLLRAWGEIGAARAFEKRARSSELPEGVRRVGDRMLEEV